MNEYGAIFGLAGVFVILFIVALIVRYCNRIEIREANIPSQDEVIPIELYKESATD